MAKAKRSAKCPVCGKPAAEATQPFCSPRCRDVDLSRWLGGHYRIPTDEQPDWDDPELEWDRGEG